MKKNSVLFLICLIAFSCKNKTTEEDANPEAPPVVADKIYPDTAWNVTGAGPHLIFKFKFDSTQIRLDNFGNPSTTIPAGRSAYSPKFNKMASHYIELATADTVAFQAGTVLYHAPETTKGGATAIDFAKSVVVKEGATFFSVPLSNFTVGQSFKWLRVSLSYQNYDIPTKANGTIYNTTVASFLGFQTYVPKYKVKTQDYIPSAASPVNGPSANHPQGYWGTETYISGFTPTYFMLDGQSQSATTTVVNANQLSQIPAGTCVVTAKFTDSNGAEMPLLIPSNPTHDIIVTVSLSTNKSFEFTDGNSDGYYEPAVGEKPVDMGIRGMIPKVQY